MSSHLTNFQGNVIDAIREAIERQVLGARAGVNGGDGHFNIEVTSPVFAGKGMLECHRIVYGAIAHLMAGDAPAVHAVDSLKTRTPAQLEDRLDDFPLVIAFVSETKVFREPEVVPRFPIVRNGPPGTFVVFGDGRKVPLPTDQIVFADDTGDGARVGFGAMSFDGMEAGRLVFHRVRDLEPEEMLSPERGRKMTLEPNMVSMITVLGREVWPLGQSFFQ